MSIGVHLFACSYQNHRMSRDRIKPNRIYIINQQVQKEKFVIHSKEIESKDRIGCQSAKASFSFYHNKTINLFPSQKGINKLRKIKDRILSWNTPHQLCVFYEFPLLKETG